MACLETIPALLSRPLSPSIRTIPRSKLTPFRPTAPAAPPKAFPRSPSPQAPMSSGFPSGPPVSRGLQSAAAPPARAQALPFAASPASAPGAPAGTQLTITRPDDWHLHLRDGEPMRCVLPFSASVFKRAIIMPNLRPPVTTTDAALAYRRRILDALPPELKGSFEPLMTLYLTDSTSPDEVRKARDTGAVHALKLYPAGATTNSDHGVTDLFGRCLPTLQYMADTGLPLLVHGEVVDPSVDFFDREAVFIERVLAPLLERVPGLRVVMEHITTADAADFVLSFPEDRIAATVTPQHMLWNRNALFVPGGLRPHNFCLPILKREKHREAVTRAATSGSRRFFLGTDSAPHERRTKEAPCGCAGIFSAHAALPLYAAIFEQAGALDRLEAFTSHNGPDFYRLPRNAEQVTLTKKEWSIPESYPFGLDGDCVVPMFAGDVIPWQIASS